MWDYLCQLSGVSPSVTTAALVGSGKGTARAVSCRTTTAPLSMLVSNTALQPYRNGIREGILCAAKKMRSLSILYICYITSCKFQATSCDLLLVT